MAKLSVVIPCYQVEGNIPVTCESLFQIEPQLPGGAEMEYVFVDDGSTDKTFSALQQIKSQKGSQVKLVKLSRNFGANSAAMAGLEYASGDCVAFFAADLQDPPELLVKMFEYWSSGIKVVVCNRKSREEGIIRRVTSGIYHILMRAIMPIKVPKGGFDLMLFDAQVREKLLAMKERNLYLPYLIMWLGFDFMSIPYVRRKREIGKSMWSLSKKIKAAIDSIAGFSYAPIRFISVMGFILGIVAMVYLGLVIYQKVVQGNAVDGWTSLMAIVLGVSSFQMISLGVIGEYVWRSFDSARARPNFIVDEVID